MKTFIPEGYKSLLSVYDTQMAIGLLHRLFEDNLSAALNIYRVSAPLFVEEASGLNDNLNGVERPVSFSISRTRSFSRIILIMMITTVHANRSVVSRYILES